MEIHKKVVPTCFYCNTEMKVDLDGWIVTNLGGYSLEGSEEKKSQSAGAKDLIETVNAKLCSCPLCGRKERITSEETEWMSFDRVVDAVKSGRIISANPEIELIFRILVQIIEKKI